MLCVPASEPSRVSKALQLDADEVVVDLEDAVPVDRKDEARSAVQSLAPRTSGRSLAVRVNGSDTTWFEADIKAVVANSAVDSIVVPKVETFDQVRAITALIDDGGKAAGRSTPLLIQALIETATGLVNASAIANGSDLLSSLILGYADLGASLGRGSGAPWLFAQDTVLVAARSAGIDAIDGPLLSVADDEALAEASRFTDSLGYDGKWVIHPRQIDTVQRAFTPTNEELEEARAILSELDAAAAGGRGAVSWRGRMLDEALAVQARRVLARGDS